MSDSYYLKRVHTQKVEKFTYEYDKFEDSMSNGSKYCVGIVFEDGKFSRLDFGDNKRKRFDDNLRQKEFNLINKIQEEIKSIEKQLEKELKPIIRLKDTIEQIELLNSMTGNDEKFKVAKEAFSACFGPVLKYVLDLCDANKISFDKLNVPSIKLKIPLEYEVEIFNPNLAQEEENRVGQGPV